MTEKHGSREDIMKPLDTMSIEEMNREMCERFGLCYHEIFHSPGIRGPRWKCNCGTNIYNEESLKDHLNPDFSADSVRLLREMRKGMRFDDFFEYLLPVDTCRAYRTTAYDLLYYVLDPTGVLLWKAVELMRGREK